MRRLFRILRLIPLAFFSAILITAALRVHDQRERDAGQPPLPSRIGQSQVELTFAEATFQEMRHVWTDLFIVFLPGMVPPPVVEQRAEPNSLDALKLRTRAPTLQTF